jgi:hypothetical protein
MNAKKAVVWAIIALALLSFVGLDLYYALNP